MPNGTNPSASLGGRRDAGGITRWEVVVLIALVAICIGLLIPHSLDVKINWNHTHCMWHLQQIGRCLSAYALDNGGRYPFTGNPLDSANWHLSLLLPRYTQDSRMFTCRSCTWCVLGPRSRIADDSGSDSRGARLQPGMNCYAYAFGLDSSSTKDSPILSDELAVVDFATMAFANHGSGSAHSYTKGPFDLFTIRGGVVLFCGGHVQFLRTGKDGRWPKTAPRMKAMHGGRQHVPANVERP